MGGIIDAITGKSAKDAEKAQALSRQQNAIMLARQLATTQAETARTGLVRRNPRGRRLLADAGKSALPSTVA